MSLRVMAQKSGDVTAEDHRLAMQMGLTPSAVLSARSGLVPSPGTASKHAVVDALPGDDEHGMRHGACEGLERHPAQEM